MPEKIRTARLSLKMAAVLFFALGLLFLFILIDGYLVAGLDGPGRRLLGNRLLGPAGFLLLFGSVVAGMSSLRAAAGLALREERARTAGIVIGFLLLPLLPFGTVLGGPIISALLGREARSWFLPLPEACRREDEGESGGERPDDQEAGS